MVCLRAGLFLIGACAGDTVDNSGAASQATEFAGNHGQAGVQDDQSALNILQIAMASPDHKTLVAAVQAAELENVLVNPGPLTVFAPNDDVHVIDTVFLFD